MGFGGDDEKKEGESKPAQTRKYQTMPDPLFRLNCDLVIDEIPQE